MPKRSSGLPNTCALHNRWESTKTVAVCFVPSCQQRKATETVSGGNSSFSSAWLNSWDETKRRRWMKSSKCWSSASKRLGVCCAAAVSVRCCTNLPLAMLQVSGTKSQSQDARHGIQLLLKMSHPPTVRNKEKTSNCLRLIDDSYWWALVPWAKQQKRTTGPGKAVKTSQKFWWTISSYSCISSRLHDAFSSDIPSGSEWIFGAPEKWPFGEIKGSVPSEFNCERLVKQVRSRHLWFEYVLIRWLMAISESNSWDTTALIPNWIHHLLVACDFRLY